MAHRGRRNADTVLVAALAAGRTHAEAAEIAGVSLRTVARRLNEPAFRHEILQARAALVEQATGRLAGSTARAADALQALLDDASPSVRLSAARALLDYAGKYVEAGDMTERINRIEALLTAQQPAPHPLKGKNPWAA